MARKRRSKKKLQPQVASRHSDETTQVQQTEYAPPSTTTTTMTPTPSIQDQGTAEATDAPHASNAVAAPSEASSGHSASTLPSCQPQPDAVPQTEPQQLPAADHIETQPGPQSSERQPTLYRDDTQATARKLPALFTTDRGHSGESAGHVTFTNPSGTGGVGATLPRSDIAYESDMPRRFRTTEESMAARLSGLFLGVASDHEVHCASRPLLAPAAVWAAWLAAHWYAAMVAWRFWSSQESVPLAGGRCAVVSIVVSVLVAAQLLATATVLSGSRLWGGVKSAFSAAAGAIGRLLLAVAFLKP